MGFMDRVGAKIATKYGVVTSGRHAACQVALGNPPGKAVETAGGFKQIIFVEGASEKGRYDIINDLAGFALLGHDERAFQVMLMFRDKETCEFNLEIRQPDKAVAGLVKGFLGQKTTSNMSPQEALEQQYRGVKVFLQNTALKFVPDDLKVFRDHLNELGILDNLTAEIIAVCLKHSGEE